MGIDVVCIGQAVVDCIIRGREEQPYKENVYRAKSISLNTGGDALNESVILSRLGHKVRLICGIGPDPAGNLIRETARENGVITDGICVREDVVTPVANLIVKEDGTRSSINSEATMLGEYLPDPAKIAGAKILSLASLFRAPLDQKETVIRLVTEAKRQGMTVCADTKLPTYRKMSLSDIKEILPLIDYLFPNEKEGEFYTGKQDFAEMAEYFRDCGVKNVIIKTGKEGCVVRGEEEAFSMGALPVTAVDSTGAGDNFVAGFLSMLLRGGNLETCCRYGTCCAAVSVQSVGAVSGVKNRQSVEEIIRQSGEK